MKGIKWTPEEKALLKTDMSAEQIAEATGRTEGAVRHARYTYTGHSVEEGKGLTTYEEKLFEAERNYHRIQKEENLLHLCKLLGVRIGGM
jgi:hypothetical protein